jgi:hypothetical protein
MEAEGDCFPEIQAALRADPGLVSEIAARLPSTDLAGIRALAQVGRRRTRQLHAKPAVRLSSVALAPRRLAGGTRRQASTAVLERLSVKIRVPSTATSQSDEESQCRHETVH